MLVKKEQLHHCQKWRNCLSLWKKNELADNQIRKFPDKSMTFLQISKIPRLFPKYPDNSLTLKKLFFPCFSLTRMNPDLMNLGGIASVDPRGLIGRIYVEDH